MYSNILNYSFYSIFRNYIFLHINFIKIQIKIFSEAEAIGPWKCRVRYSPTKRILDREVEASGHKIIDHEICIGKSREPLKSST